MKLDGTGWPKRFYVSGGMTGWPDNNQEAFDQGAQYLRERGHEVTTPVELGREAREILDGNGFNASDELYEEYLARDLALITAERFDAVMFVRGWENSGGAGREGRKAIDEGLLLYTYDAVANLAYSITPEAFLANSRVERLTPEEAEAVVRP